jgi:hypothetical protein
MKVSRDSLIPLNDPFRLRVVTAVTRFGHGSYQ